MDRVHQINAYFCFVVGTGLNLTLIWLILRKSSAELKLYSRILLQTAVLNLLFLILSAAIVPVITPLTQWIAPTHRQGHSHLQIILIDNGITLQYGVGILTLDADTSQTGSQKWMARLWNFLILTLYCCVLVFNECAVSMQFLFRYYALCL